MRAFLSRWLTRPPLRSLILPLVVLVLAMGQMVVDVPVRYQGFLSGLLIGLLIWAMCDGWRS
jgi:hypothetical protein